MADTPTTPETMTARQMKPDTSAASELPWTPDQPLRADATDEQIEARAGWWQGYVLGANGDYNRDAVPFRRAAGKPVVGSRSEGAAVNVARELAAALLALYVPTPAVPAPEET